MTRRRVLLDLLKRRVGMDAYTPVYAVQSVVASWMGDTRIVQRKPFITLEQIDEIMEAKQKEILET